MAHLADERHELVAAVALQPAQVVEQLPVVGDAPSGPAVADGLPAAELTQVLVHVVVEAATGGEQAERLLVGDVVQRALGPLGRDELAAAFIGIGPGFVVGGTAGFECALAAAFSSFAVKPILRRCSGSLCSSRKANSVSVGVLWS